jgi:pimeloyl-ACP methyl ester carboxylesterase
MNYRAVLHTTGTTKVGLFRPQTGDGPVALLLGRSPQNWYGEDESAQARALVDAGYWVVTVDTPNWGNQTDMDNIDTALTWAASFWGRDIDRVVVVAHGRGCVAALNWAIRNDEKVASISLQAPIIDLEERYSRVAADQASMAAAHGGGSGMTLPGTSGSYASTPDATSLDIVGDIDLRAEIEATDWTPSANRSIISKYTTATAQRSYRLRLLTTGRLELVWTRDGTTQNNAISTVSPTVNDGETLAVRATLDINNGAGGRTTTFYTAPTISGPWTQLGSAVTVTGAFPTGITAIFSGTAPLEVGSVATGIEAWQGQIFKAQVLDGIGGTVVANPDFTAQAPGATSFNDSTGKTWTLNGSAAITSGFTDALPTWNPAATHRKYVVRDLFRDRLTIWYSTSDSETPPSVTEDLADAYGADLQSMTNTNPIFIDPQPPTTDAVTKDSDWIGQPGAEFQKKWTTKALDTALTTDWCGADGTSSTDLGDGRKLWGFADTLIGTIDDTWRFTSQLAVNSSMVIEDAAGDLVSQVYASGSTGHAWVHNTATYPGSWRWGQKGFVEGSFVRFVCVDVTFSDGSDPKKLYEHKEQTIVSRNLSDLAIAGPTLSLGTDVQTDRILWGWSAVTQGGFTYFHAVRDYPDENWTYVARVTAGNSLTDPWEFWTGSGWSPTRSAVGRLQDTLGDDILGGMTVEYLPSSSQWVMVAMNSSLVNLVDPPDLSRTGLRVYTSTTPTGPWTYVQTVPVPDDGAERYGGFTFCYQPQIHLHLSPPGYIMVSYNASVIHTTDPDQDFTTFRPRFVVIPEP